MTAIDLGGFLPARLHHVDLAVADVQRSLDFYQQLLGPLGWAERDRYQTYRGTEEVVYLACGEQYFGIRPADGGEHQYYDVGIEHVAFETASRQEVDDAYARCVENGSYIHFAPEADRDVEGYYAFFVFDPDGIRVEVFAWDRGEPGFA